VNLYDVEPDALTATTLIWDGSEFVEVARRVLPRG
jgi:hypothetical protein